MTKNRQSSITKQPEQLPEIDNENFSKIRSSRNNHFLRQSKFLFKTEVNNFQIRKALNEFVRDELDKLDRKTYFQRVFILAHNIDVEKIETNGRYSSYKISNLKQSDLGKYYQKHFDEIFETCEKKKTTTNHLSGLYISMDMHALLMIEGPEDMIGNFFEELAQIHEHLWNNSKVFLVEDKIGETYFNSFYRRYAPAFIINEKFPPATINDPNLMAVQHLKIKKKVKFLVETLAKQLTKESKNNCELIGDFEKQSQEISVDQYVLPSDTYNQLLPEIQRIDLILNAEKFYHSVKSFALTYRVIPIYQDEDSLLWPIQNNYTPVQIFKRSPFDVNLTFGNYGEEEKKIENDGSHNMREVA